MSTRTLSSPSASLPLLLFLVPLAVAAAPVATAVAQPSPVTTAAWMASSDAAQLAEPDTPGQFIDLGGVTLHVVDEGQGPAVLLLHGFPDSSKLWRHHIPVLVDAGYRVIAPDLRGFGLSDRPEGIAAYGTEAIIGDLLGLLDALQVDTAHVVGHDWGAAFAWSLAAFAPDRVDRLVVMSVGHPMSFGDPSDLDQRQRSWYMLYFQFEGVAEAALPANDWALWRAWFGEHAEQETWFADLSRPGALTAALNLYRANLLPDTAPPQPFPPITAPTMGIWSTGDLVLNERQMADSANFVSGPFRYERIEGASHWIPLDAPDRTNALLLSFLDCADDDPNACAEPAPGEPGTPDEPGEPGGDGCSAAGSDVASGVWMAGLVALLLMGRRRRTGLGRLAQ